MNFEKKIEKYDTRLDNDKFKKLIKLVINPEKFKQVKSWENWTLVEKLIFHFQLEEDSSEGKPSLINGTPQEVLEDFFNNKYENNKKWFKTVVKKLIEKIKNNKVENLPTLKIRTPEKIKLSKIIINNNEYEINENPYNLSVPFGKHEIIIKAEGCEDIVKKINIKKPLHKLLLQSSEFKFLNHFTVSKKMEEFAPFTITVNEEKIFVQKKDLENDLVITVPENKEYEIIVEKEGYSRFNKKMLIDDETQEFSFKLKSKLEEIGGYSTVLKKVSENIKSKLKNSFFEPFSEEDKKNPKVNEVFKAYFNEFFKLHEKLLKDEKFDKENISEFINEAIETLKESFTVSNKLIIELILRFEFTFKAIVEEKINDYDNSKKLFEDLQKMYDEKLKEAWKNLGKSYIEEKNNIIVSLKQNLNELFGKNLKESAKNAFNGKDDLFNKLWEQYEKSHKRIIKGEEYEKDIQGSIQILMPVEEISDLNPFKKALKVEEEIVKILKEKTKFPDEENELIKDWKNSWEKLGEQSKDETSEEISVLGEVSDEKIIVVHKEKAGNEYEKFKKYIKEFFKLFNKNISFLELNEKLSNLIREEERKDPARSRVTLPEGINSLKNRIPKISEARMIIFDNFKYYKETINNRAEHQDKRIAFNTEYKENWWDEEYVRALVFHEFGHEGLQDIIPYKVVEYCWYKSKNCYMMQPWYIKNKFNELSGFCPLCKLRIAKSLQVFDKVFNELSDDDKLSLIKQLIISTPILKEEFKIRKKTLLETFDEKKLQKLIEENDNYKEGVVLEGFEKILSFKIEDARPYAKKLVELLKEEKETEEEKYCPYCGESLAQDDKFCESCNKPLIVLKPEIGNRLIDEEVAKKIDKRIVLFFDEKAATEPCPSCKKQHFSSLAYCRNCGGAFTTNIIKKEKMEEYEKIIDNYLNELKEKKEYDILNLDKTKVLFGYNYSKLEKMYIEYFKDWNELRIHFKGTEFILTREVKEKIEEKLNNAIEPTEEEKKQIVKKNKEEIVSTEDLSEVSKKVIEILIKAKKMSLECIDKVKNSIKLGIEINKHFDLTLRIVEENPELRKNLKINKKGIQDAVDLLNKVYNVIIPLQKLLKPPQQRWLDVSIRLARNSAKRIITSLEKEKIINRDYSIMESEIRTLVSKINQEIKLQRKIGKELKYPEEALKKIAGIKKGVMEKTDILKKIKEINDLI